MKINKNIYVQQLNEKQKEEIYNLLLEQDLCKEDLDSAMASRLCDLEDTIPLYKLKTI